MKVKICGITRREDALLAAAAGADMVGFIFYERSPRAVTAAAAAAMIAGLPRTVTPVGVFVNAPRAVVEATIRATGIRLLQFSGDESPEECAGYGLRVVKAFRLRRPEEASRIRDYAIDAALLDPAPDGVYGGSGLRADPAVALAVKEVAPLFLAGGLAPENVAEAARTIAPFALDVNSGVESSPGIKDPARVALLFERLRGSHS